MGQKTNPTALRLEKTNKHYAGCWYADYHYAPQLQNHLMVCDYINKIFQKIKRCEPFIYYKAHQQGNDIFYIFPKKRKRFSRSNFSTRNKSTFRKATNGINATTRLSSIIFGLSQWTSSSSGNKCNSSLTTSFSLFSGRSLMKNCNGYETEDFSGEAVTPYLPINKQNEWDNVKTISMDPPVSLIFNKPLLLWILCLKHSLSAGEKSADNALLGHVPWNLKQIPIVSQEAVKVKDFLKDNHRKRMEKALDNQSRSAAGPWDLAVAAAKNYTLVPIKVSSITQNAEFIAQRISGALSRRVPFNRFRRQILWEVKRFKHLKGLRVSISGRVESKSKKAQKARTRTFQWGQTELHVFSSLVQFVPKDVQTPFGKIGIKVWVCYGMA